MHTYINICVFVCGCVCIRTHACVCVYTHTITILAKRRRWYKLTAFRNILISSVPSHATAKQAVACYR